jgi:hypothetical protein
MKIFILIFTILSTLGLSAAELANPNGNPSADPNSAPAGQYGSFVGCMNRTRLVSNGISLNPNAWDRQPAEPEREPVLFFDSKTKGLFYVTPNTATYDIAPLYRPGGAYSPSYDLSFRRSDGGDSLISLFMDSEGDRPNSASTSGHPKTMQKQREANPARAYKEIARPSSIVNDTERVKNAFSHEFLRRFPTMKNDLRQAAQDNRPESKERVARFMSDAKTAFCVCVKTKRPEIISAVEAAAKDIGMDEQEYKKCNGEEPLVSQNLYFDLSILPQAHATTAPKVSARFERAGVEQLTISGDRVSACTAGQSHSYEIRKNAVQKVKCPPQSPSSNCEQIGPDAKLCVKSGSRSAGLTGAGVVLVDSKTNSREVISALEARRLAISDSWLAVADAKGISIYEIK